MKAAYLWIRKSRVTVTSRRSRSTETISAHHPQGRTFILEARNQFLLDDYRFCMFRRSDFELVQQGTYSIRLVFPFSRRLSAISHLYYSAAAAVAAAAVKATESNRPILKKSKNLFASGISVIGMTQKTKKSQLSKIECGDTP